MNRYNKYIFFLFLTVISYTANSQDEELKNWQLNGYIKDLLTLNFVDDSVLVDNLVHNRLNFKWFPNDHFTFYLETRTRIFTGDLVKLIPDYERFIDVNDDYFDLSVTVLEEKSWLVHTMIDRIYLEWINNNWEVRAGRQRINWGVNLVWNPNDLFNTFSFFDFDYEERPGSDAIRIKKYTGFASSIEFASNIRDNFDEMVLAGMWKINKKGYDIQFLAGKSGEDIAAGAGWAGNIKTAGFKGEITYFHPYENNQFSEALLASVSLDYSFESSLYFHGSMLFNSEGTDDPTQTELLLITPDKLTVRSLSPYKYSTFLQSSYQFHPLVFGNLAIIYYPGDNGLFLNPGVTVSILTNLDFDVLSQLFFDENRFTGKYEAATKLLFLRLKWSF